MGRGLLHEKGGGRSDGRDAGRSCSRRGQRRIWAEPWQSRGLGEVLTPISPSQPRRFQPY